MEKRKELDESTVLCKKCFQRGHYTYKCANERKYLQRPSTSKLMKKMKNLEGNAMMRSIDSESNKPKPQDENVDKEKPADKVDLKTELVEPNGDEKVAKKQIKTEKLKDSIVDVKNESKNSSDSTPKVIVKTDKKRRRRSKSTSSSSSSSSSSSASSSSSSSDSSSSSSDSSSSSSSSSNSSD